MNSRAAALVITIVLGAATGAGAQQPGRDAPRPIEAGQTLWTEELTGNQGGRRSVATALNAKWTEEGEPACTFSPSIVRRISGATTS